MNKSSAKGALFPLPNSHKVTLQKQFLQVVTEHFWVNMMTAEVDRTLPEQLRGRQHCLEL